MVEWVRSGVLGDIKEVHAWTNRQSVWKQTYPPKTTPIPQTLDWDLWLGPKANRPYSPAYLPSAWRYWWDFGNGALGDLAPHTLDAPVWALDLGAPVSVEAKVEHPTQHIAPKGAIVKYQFPEKDKRPPVTLIWYEPPNMPTRPQELWPGMELRPEGLMIVGTNGILYTPGWNAESPGILLPKPLWEDFKTNQPSQTIPRVPEGNPYIEWLNAIKGQGPIPAGNFNYGGPLTETILLGTIAMQTGQRIEWDSQAMKITNHPELNNRIKLAPRKGWEYTL